MKKCVQLSGVSLALIFIAAHVYSDDHVRGNYEFVIYDDLFEEVLFEKNTTEPKSYTIIFQFDSPGYRQNIEYYNFSVTAKSTAQIELIDEEDKMISRTVKAVIQVLDAKNFTVRATLRGHFRPTGPFQFSSFVHYIKRNQKQYRPKSFTMIYEHNPAPTRNRMISIGERQSGDKLLYRASKIAVRIADRMPTADFQYEDKGMSITSLEFMFDSPSAVVFLNSSFIGEHNVDAVVYDLNRMAFKTRMSVFGFETQTKPSSFKCSIRRNYHTYGPTQSFYLH